MASGFKIGEGFIEIEPDVNLAAFRAAAKAAGLAVGDEIAVGVDKKRLVIAERALAGLLTPSPAVLSALRTGVPRVLSSPLGVAGISLGAAFAASFVGAAIAVLSSAGTAAAFAVIGTLAVKENARVQAAFAETASTLKSIFTDTAAPMIEPIVASLGILRREGAKLAPDLRSIFESVAGVIPPVTKNIVDFVSVLTDAAERNMPQFSSVLEHIAAQLPGLGEHLGGFFDILGDNESTINRAVDMFFNLTNQLIDELGPAVVELTELWNQMGPTIDLLVSSVDVLVQLFNLLGAGLAFVNPLISAFADDLQEAADTIHFVTQPLTWLAEKLGLYNGVVEEASGQTITFATTLVDVQDAADKALSAMERASPAGEQMADAMAVLADSSSNATDRIAALNDVIDSLVGKNISLQEAKIKTQKAIDDLTASIEGESDSLKDNSTSLNINTERGRKNYDNILDIANGILDQIDAYAQLHGQGPKLEAFTKKSIEGFESTLRAAGLTEEQIKDVTTTIGLIPSAKNTIISATDNASQRAAAVRAALASIPRVINVAIRAISAFGEGGIVPDVGMGRVFGQYQHGGRVPLGMGGPKEDNLWARVSSGEFWVNAASTAKHLGLLEAINKDRVKYAEPQDTNTPMAQMADAASAYQTQKPVTVNVYDVNNVLLGTMQGIAEETEHRLAWEAAVGRR